MTVSSWYDGGENACFCKPFVLRRSTGSRLQLPNILDHYIFGAGENDRFFYHGSTTCAKHATCARRQRHNAPFYPPEAIVPMRLSMGGAACSTREFFG
ncbi:hypothetical protein CY34DRAFT_809711 [Suillus luteus UH-Slu-Lm8-n1]|uniref:Uncharacterized protein n=1 Tax=Suillus luteus UH-Slu-Lm8-n1 TaxID=930992 RepID=A0A0D0AUS9_9AGAM|nr:hypothetical protein CY34DRAFT_809711 [Suillus luteus UH-Slu-Lm8-n1]